MGLDRGKHDRRIAEGYVARVGLALDLLQRKGLKLLTSWNVASGVVYLVCPLRKPLSKVASEPSRTRIQARVDRATADGTEIETGVAFLNVRAQFSKQRVHLGDAIHALGGSLAKRRKARPLNGDDLAALKIASASTSLLMRAEGLEPPRAEAHQDLNLARIPIPPRPRDARRGLTSGQCRVEDRFYDRRVPVGEVRPGYELWRPNREKAGSVTTKWVIVLLLLVTAGLAGLITVGGWKVLQGGSGMGFICAVYAILYAFFAFLVARWRRGILPLAAALSMILAILCAVGADSWFARDKTGFEEALLPSSLVGVLVIVLALVQLVVIVVALYGFNQGWNIEEERPIGAGEDYGAGSGGDSGPAPQPA